MQHLQGSLFSIAATAAGPWLFIKGFGAMRVQQLIRDTPTAKLRSMAMGLVEVEGKVAPRSRVVAAVSGRPCAWWEVEIATRTSRSRGGYTSWNTVHREHSGHPFFLDDGTGVALVYPQNADCKTSFGVEEQTTGLGVPDLYMQYMTERKLAMRALWAIGPMRFRERILEEGQHVYVLGRAQPKAMSLTISMDDEALEATGTDAIGATRVRSLDTEVRGVIRRAPGDAAFLISSQSERQAAAEYGLKAFGGVVGGPLVTLFGVWCLLELIKSGQFFK